MRKNEILIIFLFALFFCLPIFLSIHNTFPRLDSDYDAVLPIYQYIGSFIRTHHAFPSSIPFVGTGITIIGDPANGILNPLLFFPLIFFDINISIRLTVLFVIFFSGLAMLYLLKKEKLSNYISYWGAFLYMTSGALIASIAAGHITEKFLVYPIYPLFFLTSLDGKMSIKKACIIGLLIAVGVYSGDLYSVWFCMILLFSIQLFYTLYNRDMWWKRILFIICVNICFLFFASPKLYFFLKDVLPIMRRHADISPFLGSIHAWFLPLQFLTPFQVSFYDRPFFQRHIGFYFNWYEYFGFLGFFPIIFFKNIQGLLKNKKIVLLLFLIFVGCLYLASAFFYSPFHWLFTYIKFVDVFRVPQRIVGPLSSIVVLLFCLIASKWKNKKTQLPLLMASILATVACGWYIFSYTFVPVHKEEIAFANEVARIDTTHAPVVNFATSQYLLTERDIPIINYYYAWVPKNTPLLASEKGIPNIKKIVELNPKYILSQNTTSFGEFGYKQVYKESSRSIWEKPNE